MPNHIQGIIILVGAPLVGAHPDNGTYTDNGIHGSTVHRPTVHRATTRVAPTLGDIIWTFKSLVTVEYANDVKQLGWMRSDWN